MFGILKDKAIYSKIILSVVPLTLVCNTAFSSALAGIIVVFAVALSWTATALLKNLLTPKTAPFSRIIIAVGVIGVLSMVFSLFFKETVESLGIYLTLISVTVVALVSTEDILNEAPLNVLKHSAVIGAAAAVFLFFVGVLKEFFGMGSLFGFDVYTSVFAPMEFFKTAAGSLIVCAALTVLYGFIVKLIEKRAEK